MQVFAAKLLDLHLLQLLFVENTAANHRIKTGQTLRVTADSLAVFDIGNIHHLGGLKGRQK